MKRRHDCRAHILRACETMSTGSNTNPCGDANRGYAEVPVPIFSQALTRRVALLGIFVSCLMSQPALAQRASVGVQEGPHFPLEPVLVQVTTEGFDTDPIPTCEPGAAPPGFTISSTGSPGVESRVISINNRVTKFVRFKFSFLVMADKAGTYRVPSFTMTQGKAVVKTKTFELNFENIAADPNMRVSLVLPSGPVFPGQRVPIEVEWWYAGDVNAINKEVRRLQVRVPMFDRFNFIDEPLTRSDTPMPVVTAKGELHLKAAVATRKLDGRSFTVLSAKRQWVVDKPGEHKIAAPSVTVEKVTRWGRDFFGNRVPTSTRRLRAVGQPQKLLIQPLPLDQAPASFAGAVGRGFSIDVKADRSVLRVDDPIVLTITLRGDGNLSNAGLPTLAATTGGPAAVGYGLDAQRFRLPAAEIPGTLSEDKMSKVFKATVRVLEESVTELGPIAYSWFDPDKKKFQTAHSDPIALRVLPTKTVGASQVVRAGGKDDGNGRTDNSTTTIGAAAVTGGGADNGRMAPANRGQSQRLDLTGAELAITTDPARLLMDESKRFGGRPVLITIYGASILLIGFAWWRRRAAQIDPELLRRRSIISKQLATIARASNLPRHDAAAHIAAALRQIVAHAIGESNRAERSQIDRLLAECDVLAFTPNADSNQRIDATLHERALQVVSAIAKQAA